MRRETLARVHLSIAVRPVIATIPPGVNAKGLLNVLRDQATVLQLTSAFKQPSLAVRPGILILHLRKSARDHPTARQVAVTVLSTTDVRWERPGPALRMEKPMGVSKPAITTAPRGGAAIIRARSWYAVICERSALPGPLPAVISM
jgi:hypothetical protein